MFACKYQGGMSSKRIMKAFEFLKKRSEEAVRASEREAAELQKQAQAAAAKASGDASEQEGPEETPVTGGDETNNEENSAENPYGLKRRRAPYLSVENTFPKGGAGLVSLLGDVSSLEQRIQGGWNLVIKTGGRLGVSFFFYDDGVSG